MKKIHQIIINDNNNIPTSFSKYSKKCFENIKSLHHDFDYQLYSGEDIKNIIKNNFSDEIIETYNMFIPYAYKCDLARYCILYLYGGLYVDLGVLYLNSLDLKETDFFAFRDISKFSDPWWAVNNSIIYSKPKSNIIKTAIDLVVYHSKINFYGVSAIDVSGPTVLGKSIMRSEENFDRVFTNGQVDRIDVKNINIEEETLKSFGYDTNKITGFILDETKKIIALRKPAVGGNIQSIGFEGTNNYVDLWLNKCIYKSDILK